MLGTNNVKVSQATILVCRSMLKGGLVVFNPSQGKIVVQTPGKQIKVLPADISAHKAFLQLKETLSLERSQGIFATKLLRKPKQIELFDLK